jgi:hypothetical protein
MSNKSKQSQANCPGKIMELLWMIVISVTSVIQETLVYTGNIGEDKYMLEDGNV